MTTASALDLSKSLWDLPSGWSWIALDEVCIRIDGGGTPQRSHSEYFNGNIIWITPTDLDVNNPIKEVKTSQTKITQEGYSSSSAKMLPRGTVLFSSRASIGKIGIAGIPLCTNQGFVNFVCGNAINNHYLAWCLRRLTSEIIKLAGSTTYLEVSRGNLRRFKIPIPYPHIPTKSLDIQQRIVTRIEALLAEVRESHDLLDRIRRDCDQLLAVSLSKVFSKVESVTDFVPFKKVATAFNGRATGSGSSTVRVFKTRHVYPHTLRLNDPSYAKPEQVSSLPNERFLRPGDVLMTNIAEGTLGRVSYVEEVEESWTVDTQIMILRSKDKNGLLGKWLYYYLCSEQGQQEILSRRTGIAFADKRGQTHIYPTNVVEIPVPKPIIDVQHQAVAYLDAIVAETEKMKKLIEQDAKTFDLLEQSILERAFRGEL